MASSLLDSLTTDQVLSVAQLRRHYGMSESEAVARGARGFVVAVAETQNSAEELHRFVVLARKRPFNDGGNVRHLTGVAEMRYLLGATHDAWVSEADKHHVRNEPDGVWSKPEGDVAIEYDAGSYSPKQIVDKLSAFQAGYSGQIWGSPSKQRVAHIKKLAADIESDLQVLYAPWF